MWSRGESQFVHQITEIVLIGQSEFSPGDHTSLCVCATARACTHACVWCVLSCVSSFSSQHATLPLSKVDGDPVFQCKAGEMASNVLSAAPLVLFPPSLSLSPFLSLSLSLSLSRPAAVRFSFLHLPPPPPTPVPLGNSRAQREKLSDKHWNTRWRVEGGGWRGEWA